MLQLTLLSLAMASLVSAKVTCTDVNSRYSLFITDEIIGLGKSGTAAGPYDPDGYYRTLAIKDNVVQTINDNYTYHVYDMPENYDGIGMRVTFFPCAGSFFKSKKYAHPKHIGKLAIEPTATPGTLSPGDKCLTFHPQHKQFGSARCSFSDDASQEQQTFVTDRVGWVYRFLGPPTDVDAFKFKGPGWALYPTPNAKGEWTVRAEYSAKPLDTYNGFVKNLQSDS